jgi:toxin ParE1/3/4
MTSLASHPAAKREQYAATIWYAEQNPKVAIDFVRDLDAMYARIATNPLQFPLHLRGTRKAILSRFPYSIVFRELPDVIQILAVAHAKRRPGYWKSRLKSF